MQGKHDENINEQDKINMQKKAIVEQGAYLKQQGRIKSEIEKNIIVEQTKFNLLKSMLPCDFDDKVILDIGGGAGSIAMQVARSKCKYVILDISPVAVKLANLFSKKQENADKVHFIVADAHNLPIKSGSANIVIITDVLEHVVKPQKVLKEANRTLKKSGFVYVTVPYAFGIETMMFDDVIRLMYKLKIRKQIPIHLSSFTKWRIRTMFLASGFKACECRYLQSSQILFLLHHVIPETTRNHLEKSLFRKTDIAIYGQAKK